MTGHEPRISTDLTGGRAYILTERNTVRNRTGKFVLVLLKRCGARLAYAEGLAALQRQLQHAAWCQFSKIHKQLLQAKEKQCLSKNQKDD